MIVIILCLTLPLLARPTRTQTAPGQNSMSGAGPRGSSYSSSSNVVKTPRGVKASGQGSAQGYRGGSASGQGTFQGNQTQGSGQGSAQWKTPRGGSGSANGQGSYNQGTVEGSADWNHTTSSGQTTSGNASGSYNQGSGGSATVTTSQGSKTVTVPPKP